MKIPQCVDQVAASCGEGLLWDARCGCLWWVDIAKERLHRFDPKTGAASFLQLPYLISALALRSDGALLIATIKGLGIIDPQSGTIEILHDPEPDIAGNRLNDISAAPDGALWVGTMSEGAKGKTGSLYRYGEGGPTQEVSGTTLSNGIDWSPDGARMYFIDTVPGSLSVLEDGIWSILKEFDDTTGRPDGLCVDRDGTLWIAICDRGYVMGMSLEGAAIARIDLPCEIITNCAFGGLDLKTLFITTGNYSMTEEAKMANPLAGGLFAVEMDVAGKLPHIAKWPI